MDKQIWMYRHAESLSNAGERTFDVTQIPLSEKGHKQALELAAAIPEAPSAIITSPFLRTAQTAEPAAARFGSAGQAVWPIQEFTYLEPLSCIGTSWLERKPRIDAYWARLDPDYVDGPGAESFGDLMARARAFLERAAGIEHALALLVSHGQFMQMAMLLAEQPLLPPHEAMAAFRDRQAQRPFANCERLRLTIGESGLTIAGRG